MNETINFFLMNGVLFSQGKYGWHNLGLLLGTNSQDFETISPNLK